jgi:hypothetical protein
MSVASKPEALSRSCTMSFDASFTLCPSNGGAFGSYGRCHGTKKSSPVKSQSILKKNVSMKALTSRNHVDNPHAIPEQHQQLIIPGTLLQDWMLPSHNLRRSLSIRASPFEPLAHHRNLPKSGTISPLNVQEHGCVPQQPHCIPPASSMPATDSHPIAEIRIPTPQTLQAGSKDEDDSLGAAGEEDYKTLYLCCQRDLHESQEHMAETTEENRLLKRQLIQLQKQLFTSTRTKRSSTVSWSIPESTNKRRRSSP